METGQQFTRPDDARIIARAGFYREDAGEVRIFAYVSSTINYVWLASTQHLTDGAHDAIAAELEKVLTSSAYASRSTSVDAQDYSGWKYKTTWTMSRIELRHVSEWVDAVSSELKSRFSLGTDC